MAGSPGAPVLKNRAAQRVRNREARSLLPRVAPSLVLQRACDVPRMRVPVGSWDRCQRELGVIALVGMRQMGSWQVASPLATTGAHALRSARYAPLYLAAAMSVVCSRSGDAPIV